MKKGFGLILGLLITISAATACGTPSNTEPITNGAINDMNCQQIVDYIKSTVAKNEYLAVRLHNDYVGVFSLNTVQQRSKWFLGVENVPMSDACAVESEIEPSDFSLVVIRLSSDVKYEQWRKTINDNISSMKWICAGAETKRVERIGDVILVILADNTNAGNIANAFLTLS